MKRRRLQLLSPAEDPGVGRDDPIRFYASPVFGRLYRRRVELCLDHLPGGRRILEIGFGSGATFPNLVELYDEVWGVDPGVEVEAIQSFWRERGISTRLLRGSVPDLPFPEGHF